MIPSDVASKKALSQSSRKRTSADCRPDRFEALDAVNAFRTFAARNLRIWIIPSSGFGSNKPFVRIKDGIGSRHDEMGAAASVSRSTLGNLRRLQQPIKVPL
jgi:hypothetical protein